MIGQNMGENVVVEAKFFTLFLKLTIFFGIFLVLAFILLSVSLVAFLILFLLFVLPFTASLALHIYVKNCSLTITDKGVYCNKMFVGSTSLTFDAISLVTVKPFLGSVCIDTTKTALTINFVKNHADVKRAIEQLMEDHKAQQKQAPKAPVEESRDGLQWLRDKFNL